MIDVVDFFCGCGGTSSGLQNAGMKILAGIDLDSEAGATFKLNFPDAQFLLEDIRNLHTFNLETLLSRQRQNPLLFAACAPCQPFTKQKTNRKRKDDRASLLDELHRFVRVFRPDYVLIENVPGLQNVTNRTGPLNRLVRLLNELEYEFSFDVLRSQDYGVPQLRRRFVLVASLLGEISLPERTHGPNTSNPKFERAGDWLKGLPPIRAGGKSATVKNHVAAQLSPTNLQRIRATPPGGGRQDWPKNLRLECHSQYDGHTDVYGRIHKERPAPALTTRCISLSNGRYGHPTQHRAISVREAARLQTFDDGFEFAGNLTSMARQIGNAVPVRLAEVLGDHLSEHCRNAPFFATEAANG